MDRKKFFLACCIAASGLTVNYLAVRSIEREKRDEITAKSKADLQAIYIAAERMNRKIMNGQYSHDEIKKLMEDFDFEIIAAHYE